MFFINILLSIFLVTLGFLPGWHTNYVLYTYIIKVTPDNFEFIKCANVAIWSIAYIYVSDIEEKFYKNYRSTISILKYLSWPWVGRMSLGFVSAVVARLFFT